MIYAFLISIIYFTLLSLNENRALSPDSKRYILGERLHSPFHLRWLLPAICRQSEMLWNLFTLIPIILIPVVMYAYLKSLGFNEIQSLTGCALTCGLPGVIIINYVAKYLSDGFAMLMMLFSVLGFQTGNIILGVLCSVVGSMAKEQCFIYSFLISWNPLSLIGALPVIIRALTYKPNPVDILGGEEILKHPLISGIKIHKGRLFEMKQQILTWGACLFALGGQWNLQSVIVIFAAYASQLLTTDSTRVYMWCFPVVVVLAVSVIPESYALPLVVLHWFNPFRKLVT